MSLKLRVSFDAGSLENRIRQGISINLASQRSAKEVIKDMYNILYDQIEADLNEPKSGVLWNYSTPGFHPKWRNVYSRPSGAPGEAPASQSGNLMGSIDFYSTGEASGYMEIAAIYAAYQEFGDWTSWYGNKIEARPFVRPAIGKSLKKFNEAAVTRYRRELRI